MPDWRRYEMQPDAPYVKGHWYDPFNRNKLKGDYPIFGQRWFFNFTGTSETGFDGRRLPTPSGLSSDPGDSGFFGRGEQAFVSENLRLSFDLFRGDTSFRPVDFRVRITPEINLNFLQTRERGLVNIDTRKGRTASTRISDCRKHSSKPRFTTSVRITTSCQCAPESNSSAATFADLFFLRSSRGFVSLAICVPTAWHITSRGLIF